MAARYEPKIDPPDALWRHCCTCLHHLRCAATGCVQRMLQNPWHTAEPAIKARRILGWSSVFPPASALGMVPILLLRNAAAGVHCRDDGTIQFLDNRRGSALVSSLRRVSGER